MTMIGPQLGDINRLEIVPLDRHDHENVRNLWPKTLAAMLIWPKVLTTFHEQQETNASTVKHKLTAISKSPLCKTQPH